MVFPHSLIPLYLVWCSALLCHPATDKTLAWKSETHGNERALFSCSSPAPSAQEARKNRNASLGC